MRCSFDRVASSGDGPRQVCTSTESKFGSALYRDLERLRSAPNVGLAILNLIGSDVPLPAFSGGSKLVGSVLYQPVLYARTLKHE